MLRKHAVAADVLLELCENDVNALGLPMGDRLRFTKALRSLEGGDPGGAPSVSSSGGFPVMAGAVAGERVFSVVPAGFSSSPAPFGGFWNADSAEASSRSWAPGSRSRVVGGEIAAGPDRAEHSARFDHAFTPGRGGSWGSCSSPSVGASVYRSFGPRLRPDRRFGSAGPDHYGHDGIPSECTPLDAPSGRFRHESLLNDQQDGIMGSRTRTPATQGNRPEEDGREEDPNTAAVLCAPRGKPGATAPLSAESPPRSRSRDSTPDLLAKNENPGDEHAPHDPEHRGLGFVGADGAREKRRDSSFLRFLAEAEDENEECAGCTEEYRAYLNDSVKRRSSRRSSGGGSSGRLSGVVWGRKSGGGSTAPDLMDMADLQDLDEAVNAKFSQVSGGNHPRRDSGEAGRSSSVLESVVADFEEAERKRGWFARLRWGRSQRKNGAASSSETNLESRPDHPRSSEHRGAVSDAGAPHAAADNDDLCSTTSSSSSSDLMDPELSEKQKRHANMLGGASVMIEFFCLVLGISAVWVHVLVYLPMGLAAYLSLQARQRTAVWSGLRGLAERKKVVREDVPGNLTHLPPRTVRVASHQARVRRRAVGLLAVAGVVVGGGLLGLLGVVYVVSGGGGAAPGKDFFPWLLGAEGATVGGVIVGVIFLVAVYSFASQISKGLVRRLRWDPGLCGVRLFGVPYTQDREVLRAAMECAQKVAQEVLAQGGGDVGGDARAVAAERGRKAGVRASESGLLCCGRRNTSGATACTDGSCGGNAPDESFVSVCPPSSTSNPNAQQQKSNDDEGDTHHTLHGNGKLDFTQLFAEKEDAPTLADVVAPSLATVVFLVRRAG